MTQSEPSTQRIAVAQIDARRDDLKFNLERVVQELRVAVTQDVDLIVFPECILTGYLYDDFESTQRNALQLTGDAMQALTKFHTEHAIHSVIGFLERDGDSVFNTAALFGPDGLIGTYRKQHLPFLGADRFVSPGQLESRPVFPTAIGNVGVMICYDLRYPECARELALQGADIIAMPTNWAGASTILADLVVRVRALENLVYLAVADRNDVEAGVQFIGRSQIISPRGEVLVDARSDNGTFTSDVSLEDSRVKEIIIEPGVFELPVFTGRRPELYRTLTTPTADIAADLAGKDRA
ncbi:MAG: carbon-nitrogen hydrolase family protein [Leucobacter sp.]